MEAFAFILRHLPAGNQPIYYSGIPSKQTRQRLITTPTAIRTLPQESCQIGLWNIYVCSILGLQNFEKAHGTSRWIEAKIQAMVVYSRCRSTMRNADLYDDDPLTWCIAELSQYAYALPIFLPKVYGSIGQDRKKWKRLNRLVLIIMNELTVLWKAQYYLKINYQRGDYLNPNDLKYEEGPCLVAVRLTMAVEYNQPVVESEDSPDIYRRAAELKVVRHGGRQDAPWLAPADAMQVQFTNVLTSLVSEAVKGFAAEKYPATCDCYL